MKTIALSILIGLVCLSFSNPQTPAGKVPKWLYGYWKGTGYQIDGQTWSIELSMEDGDVSPLIRYPSLGCGGKWNISATSKNRLDLSEEITDGKTKCDNGCQITLFKIDDEQIAVVYTLPSFSEDAIAWAVIKRETPTAY